MAGVGPLPLLTLPVRPVCLPPLLLSPRIQQRVSAMPASPSEQSGVGGNRSRCDRSASGRDRSPQPGPLGLGSGGRSAPRADQSRSGFRGRFSPTPSGVADDDRNSISSSVDLD